MAGPTEALTFRKSPGPVSPHGKKTSSQNSFKHGCRALSKILPGESPDEYNQLWDNWLIQYEPESPVDLELLANVVDAQWRLWRSERALCDVERALLTLGQDASAWSPEQMKQLHLMLRYKTTAENSFQRSLRTVQFMKDKQTARVNQQNRLLEIMVDMNEKDPTKAKRMLALAQAAVTKSGIILIPKDETPLTRAAQLFQGQNHPKKKRKIVRMEQWVEIRIVDGKTVTRLYPPNEKLIKEGQAMLPPPEFVYRRLNFPDGVPEEYNWTGIWESQRKLGGCGIQRMTVDTWLDVIDREKLRPDGHIGQTGVGNLPRPKEHGECHCHVCTHNQAILDRLANTG
jgi:hypothetical protein